MASPVRVTRLLLVVLLSGLSLGILSFTLPGCGTSKPVAMTVSDAEAERWARKTLAGLTLDQKVAQLFAAQTRGFFYNASDPEYQRLVDLVERFEIGGFIFSIGEPLAQAILTNDLQERSKVPLLITQDMEWGLGMRLARTTTFPRAMALGAARDPDLAYAMGLAVAEEARSIGVHQNYAPVADINNNPLNPIINVRSYGSDPRLVGSLASAYARGLQDGGLIATVKHFPGHGDTEVDSHADLPVLSFSRARLDSLELGPFRAVLDAGVKSVMVAHLAFPAIEPDSTVPATLSPNVVTGILREDLGFEGLVVTDALIMEGVTKHFGSGEAAVRALEAGIDHLLMPEDIEAAHRAVMQAVASGRLSEAQIDRAALRVLTAKGMMNLQARRTVPIDSIRYRIATPGHLALRNEIARRSLTLLHNADGLIPISPQVERVLCITLNDGSEPDAGAFFLEEVRSRLPESTVDHLLLDARSDAEDYAHALKKAGKYDLVLVPTFLRVRSWTGQIALPEDQQAFLNGLSEGAPPVALISFGNPYLIIGLEKPDVFAAAYGGSDGSQLAAVQGLFGEAAWTGRLPITIPGVYDYGGGLEVEQTRLRAGVPEEIGMQSDVLERVDGLIRDAIRNRAFPGAAVAIGRAGVLAKVQGYGYFTYESEKTITPNSLFDLASLTKVVATTTAVMILHDEGLIDLDAPISRYLPEFGRNGKAAVTVRHVLTHTGGLTPFYPFYTQGVTSRDDVLQAIFQDKLRTPPGSAYAYSDLGMIVLALAVERITGQGFDAFTRERIFQPLGMWNTGFRPAAGVPDPEVVPTEIDRDFRKQLVQGEVHDENAWILGGVAGHAGLFSTASDLAKFAQMLLNGGTYNGRRIVNEETIRLFTARAPNEIGHTRALGWDTRADEGYSSAGNFFGPNSFGHTGFTGTSIWIDPDADLFVILLTNRVHPTRDNRRLFEIRPVLADIAYESIVLPSSSAPTFAR